MTVKVKVWRFDRGNMGKCSHVATIDRRINHATMWEPMYICCSGPLRRKHVEYVHYNGEKYMIRKSSKRMYGIWVPGDTDIGVRSE